jgi:hypothetical protein
LLYIAVFVEQYCDIMQANALPENEGILEGRLGCSSVLTGTDDSQSEVVREHDKKERQT